MFSLKTNIRVEFEIATAGTWIWSVSTWNGGDVWGGASSTVAWTDLLCETFEINIERGCDVDSGILVNPSQNQTVVRMQSVEYDPFVNGTIHAGTPVRITIDPDGTDTWQEIYVGKVQSFQTSYNAQGLNNIEFVAVDDMTAFLNTRLDTFDITAGQTAADVIDILVYAYWQGGIYLDTNFLTTLEATSYTNTTVGAVINDVLNSELGYLYVAQNGEINFIAHSTFDSIVETGPAYFFESTHSSDPGHICMSDLVMDANSNNLPNQIKATNSSLELTATNTDAVELYGPLAFTVPTIVEDATQLQLVLDAITLNVRLRRARALTFQPIQRDGEFRSWHLADRLFNCVNVSYDLGGLTLNENYVVTKQIDIITPESWDTTLELWRGI